MTSEKDFDPVVMQVMQVMQFKDRARPIPLPWPPPVRSPAWTIAQW